MKRFLSHPERCCYIGGVTAAGFTLRHGLNVRVLAPICTKVGSILQSASYKMMQARTQFLESLHTIFVNEIFYFDYGFWKVEIKHKIFRKGKHSQFTKKPKNVRIPSIITNNKGFFIDFSENTASPNFSEPVELSSQIQLKGMERRRRWNRRSLTSTL